MIINQIAQRNSVKNSPAQLSRCRNNTVANNQLERCPSRDCVSFKGTGPILQMGKILDNPNSVNAIKFANSLITEITSAGVCSLEVLNKVIKAHYPDVVAKNIKELEGVIPNISDYKAYSMSDIDDEFRKVSLGVFVSLPKSVGELKDFISDTSHEFTHICQEHSETFDVDILKRVSCSNKQVAQTVRALYDGVFRVFDTNSMSYVDIVAGDDSRKVVDTHVRQIVRQCVEQMADEPDPTHMLDFMKAYSEPESLVADTKSYCAYRAKQEKEAYATEFALARTLQSDKAGAYAQVVKFFVDLEDSFK